MVKRGMIGLFAIGVVMMLGTEANAACVDLGNGDLWCADWYTGSVQCKVQATTDCKDDNCFVDCTAQNTTPPSGFAFCRAGTRDPVIRRACNIPFFLKGSSSIGKDDCEGDVCKKTILLLPSDEHERSSSPLAPEGCAECCQHIETCVDFTPQAMDTTASITVSEDYSSDRRGLALPSEDIPTCPSDTSCTQHNRCQINPNEIRYLQEKQYTCKLLELE